MFCVRSASPRCGNATTTRWPARTNCASSDSASDEAARGDRRPLRLERERLRLRERVELGRALERDRRRGRPPPRRGARRRAGRRSPARGRAPARDRRDAAGVSPSSPCHSSTRSRRRSAAGIDRARLDRVQRALRERRERADRLDLVAEELDAQRLAPGRREDVDEPAANGELAAVVDALDALVARERELLGERVDAELARPAASSIGAGRAAAGGSGSATRERRGARRARRARARRARAHARRRGAAAARARTPSGRRGSAAAPTRSSPRNQAAASATSRASASSGTRQTSGRSSARERREHDRQRRLGDARTRRQRLGERGEALVVQRARGRTR